MPAKKKQAVPSVGTPEERRAFLGGSDAAGALGISPWRTPYQLWCEKTGIELAPDLSQIDYIYFGHLLEPVVAQIFTEKTGISVFPSSELFQHPKHRFLAGHVDRLLAGHKHRGFLECKSANAFDHRDWGKSEGGAADIPPHYLAQVDHYMLVRDDPWCYVAVLIGGNDFRWYRIERDAKREAKLLAAELALWKLVKSKKPPPITNELDAKHRWKKIAEGSSIPVAADIRSKIVRLSAVTERIKELEKEEKEIRNIIFPTFTDREYLSDSTSGEPLARLVSYGRKYFDEKAFAAKHPKIAKNFTDQRTSKRLSILI